MKTEKLEVELYHYIDKDYECKYSEIIVKLNYNNIEDSFKVTGIKAEALMNIIVDLFYNEKNRKKKKEVDKYG